MQGWLIRIAVVSTAPSPNQSVSSSHIGKGSRRDDGATDDTTGAPSSRRPVTQSMRFILAHRPIAATKKQPPRWRRYECGATSAAKHDIARKIAKREEKILHLALLRANIFNTNSAYPTPSNLIANALSEINTNSDASTAKATLRPILRTTAKSTCKPKAAIAASVK